MSFRRRQRRSALLLASLSIPLAAAVVLASPWHRPSGPGPGRLIVHEWGTFLSTQGSDGVSLGGMVDSEELLPLFVRQRSLGGRPRFTIDQKMETPVTYFYVDQPRTVQVRVGMPQGILTHWYPAVRSFGPPLSNPKAEASADSFLDWGAIELLPDTPSTNAARTSPPAGFRPVSQDDTWRLVRETDAAFVRLGPGVRGVRKEGEVEKFLL